MFHMVGAWHNGNPQLANSGAGQRAVDVATVHPEVIVAAEDPTDGVGLL